MLKSIIRFSDGSILSEDEDKVRRYTSLTVYNICKRVGFPKYSGVYKVYLDALREGNLTPEEYLNGIINKLTKTKEALNTG